MVILITIKMVATAKIVTEIGTIRTQKVKIIDKNRNKINKIYKMSKNKLNPKRPRSITLLLNNNSTFNNLRNIYKSSE